MHIHFLGICGTFMAGLAIIAKQLGHEVSGQDANVYPPMSTQLQLQGIQITSGYDPIALNPAPDLVVIGNALSRGNAVVEYVLERGINYTSGTAWLFENVLKDRWVLAVAGTHGKTTTTSMLTFILDFAGLAPGYLIGGVPENFGVSARLGKHPFFVIEADEYDSAFFDKRAKFIHYHPRTLIMNNLEYDHADIYPDLESIKKQFHFLVRTVPGNGLIIYPENDDNLKAVLEKGCWTPTQTFAEENADIHAENISPDASEFDVVLQDKIVGSVKWQLIGMHNLKNALAAITAARHAGVSCDLAIEALNQFRNVKRRLELKANINQIEIYDDFAHHPTAMAVTLKGLRAKMGSRRIITIVEMSSYTLKSGVLKDQLPNALKESDQVLIARPKGENWGLNQIAASHPNFSIYENVDSIVLAIKELVQPNDCILVMAKSGFDNIHTKLQQVIENK